MLRQFLPAIIWAGLILFLSIFPGKKIPKVEWHFLFQLDKIAHVCIYFAFALSIGWSLRNAKSLHWHHFGLLIGFCGLYGLLMEALQFGFLSDRSFEIHDIIANIIGSIIGGAFVYFMFNKMKRL